MNERVTSSTHDTDPEMNRTPRFEHVPDGLQVEVLDQIVDKGEQARREYEADPSIAESADAHIDAKMEEALQENGFSADSDDANEQHDYRMAKETYNTAARTKAVDWYTPPVDDPSAPSLRRQRINHLREYYEGMATFEPGSEADTDNNSTDGASPVGGRFELPDDQRASLNAYREADQALARKEARRFRVGMFARKEKRNQLDQEIEPAAVAYGEQARLFDAIQEQKYRTMYPDISDEALAQKMARYHTAKQRLHDLRVEDEAENSHNKFGVLSKWHNNISKWYGGLGRGEKIGIAAAGVATAGLVGLALGPLGAAGTALLAGAKGYRSYMQSRSELYRRPEQAETIQSVNEQGASKSLAELQDESLANMATARTERSEKTDKVNKRAKIATFVGGAALGGGILLEYWDDLQRLTQSAVGGVSGSNQDAGGTGNEAPQNDQAREDARAQAEADRAEADAEARENAVPKSDTPDVAESLREGLGGDVSGAPATGPFSGELGTTTLTPSGLEALTQSLEGYTVKSGDSVWNLAEQHLRAQGVANPSVYQIDAAKDAILPVLQAHGAADANGWLTAGQRISLR